MDNIKNNQMYLLAGQFFLFLSNAKSQEEMAGWYLLLFSEFTIYFCNEIT